MEYKDLAIHFTDLFEEYKPILREHIKYNGEILNHIFFGECNDYFIEFIGNEKDIPKIQKLFRFLELMATSGDNDVKDLLSVTILARLGDSKKLLKTAYKYMDTETRKASEEIEMSLGRT